MKQTVATGHRNCFPPFTVNYSFTKINPGLILAMTSHSGWLIFGEGRTFKITGWVREACFWMEFAFQNSILYMGLICRRDTASENI